MGVKEGVWQDRVELVEDLWQAPVIGGGGSSGWRGQRRRKRRAYHRSTKAGSPIGPKWRVTLDEADTLEVDEVVLVALAASSCFSPAK